MEEIAGEFRRCGGPYGDLATAGGVLEVSLHGCGVLSASLTWRRGSFLRLFRCFRHRSAKIDEREGLGLRRLGERRRDRPRTSGNHERRLGVAAEPSSS